MDTKNCYLIVRTSALKDHPDSTHDVPIGFIPLGVRPTAVYYDEGAEEVAERELLRLTAAHPEEEFMLFRSHKCAEMRAPMDDGLRVAVITEPRRVRL